ncbi:Protein kinase domain [Trinorchestia longiramus]|nr:Protein kinase domain [Trinorchestia longiramus]
MKLVVVVCLEVCGRLGKCVTVVAQLLRLEAGREETDRRDGLPQASGPLSPATYSSSSSITRDVLQQLYTFGFEYHRDVCRLFSSSSSSEQARVVSHLVSFSQSWMKFCHQHYPQGSGSRPRWSANGLDFLLYTCSPQHLRHVHKRQAQAFLNEVQQCYHHIVGLAKPEPVLPPAPLTPSTARKQFRSSSSSVSTRSTSESPSPRVPMIDARLGPEFPSVSSSTRPSALLRPFAHPGRGIARVRDSIVRLEHELQKKRLQTKAVGHVIEAPPTNASDSSPLSRYKTIGFSWHRGFKIGSGQFGKVYTAVNNSTGELLALKVQPISHTDRKLVAKMVEELRILEGFSHPNLVKYYGMEILEDELLFFMEYCEEGTLEHLSYSTEFGLPEEMVRRYTRQLLDGVAALHDCGVIHRDIKGANIFLTHESLNLKLGDFGCAVRLRGDRTEVGELAGIAGTHAFMAPEIFQCAGGYGRAADVWSLACVVIEMCTAKRPWPELNNSAQIMFKVGMGQSPACPPSLSKEGQDFLSKCFVHDPQERATASSLLHHPFVKVELDEDNYSLPLYSGTQQYYAYNTTFEHSS